MMSIPDPGELRQAMEYEADKYIPFDVSEVQPDAQRLHEVDVDAWRDRADESVLLVAAKKNLIEEHVNLLQSVGLQPEAVDVDFLALGNAFELAQPVLGVNDTEVRALVDVGASKTDINIMRGNASFFQGAKCSWPATT